MTLIAADTIDRDRRPEGWCRLHCAGATDVGRKRTRNEDQFLVADLAKSLLIRGTSLDERDRSRLFGGSTGKILLVADGMGGHRGGERASELAVDEVLHWAITAMPWCSRLEEGGDHDFPEDLKQAMIGAQNRIETAAAANPALSGMGTTVTMGYVIGRRFYVVHVGDSRCYLFRGGRLTRLTTDHTVAHRLMEEGVLDREEAENSPQSHVLWNAVGGGSSDLVPEVRKTQLRLEDRVLLCTDGLTRHVGDDAIRRLLEDSRSAEEACELLIGAANDGGGDDNITVVVAWVMSGSE